jgi:hypothetical protein
VVIGALHTFDGAEIDTAWRAAVAPWDWEITESDFLSQALSSFGSGQIVKYTHQGTGESVAFQPQSLQFTNDLNQINQIGALASGSRRSTIISCRGPGPMGGRAGFCMD